ncbi:nicotinamide N-methyltransferase-like [Dendropsophus ebraccatus]|uniref:nicotinamide N-methyltransferase-like n=1 Tax=Dendropsophus ebraccatus TaxID=150705 RepID=UPI0038318006
MASSTHKLYHVHGFDSRQFLEHYLAENNEIQDDSLKFPIENLTRVFTKGHINGNVLIDLSIGSMVHHLYSACEFFKHIIVLKVSDRCIMELKRWLDTRTGAFDWGHAIKLHGEIEEKSHQLEEKEGKVRSAVQHVVRCHLDKENMTHPIVLPPADCIIIAWLLGAISKDQDDYIRYFGKFSKLLKPGGYLIIIEDLEGTFYTVGKDRHHYFKQDEDFIRKVLAGEGFVIDYCNVKERTAVSDLLDFKASICIAAHKGK